MPLSYARLICTLILHLFLLGELTGALERMKFVLNQEYLFEAPNYAFANTLTQAAAVLTTEFCSVMVILASSTSTDVVMNFIALAIIAAFDDFVYSSTANEVLKKLLLSDVQSDLCVVRHTTSKRAKERERVATRRPDEDEPPQLKITFKGRTRANKAKRVCYKALRLFYVSAYFYFEPFFIVLLAAWLPLLRYCHHSLEDCISPENPTITK